MESTLRLISSNPVDRLARTVEALLVVASAPLSIDELCDATEDDAERIRTALGLLRERYAEGRSGIVLEEVAGGFAFRASREHYQETRFPPLSAWMVFTDGISHSVLTGQHALVTTVLVPLANCQIPELAPYRVLARAAAA